MKQREYTEGPEAPEALKNFERFATAILQAPKAKKKRPKKAAVESKPKRDKD